MRLCLVSVIQSCGERRKRAALLDEEELAVAKYRRSLDFRNCDLATISSVPFPPSIRFALIKLTRWAATRASHRAPWWSLSSILYARVSLPEAPMRIEHGIECGLLRVSQRMLFIDHPVLLP